MKLSIGLVGLPNVGKSTLFKALTKLQVEASNYPFCTIDPNVGCVTVPDERLEALSNASKSKKTIYTTIEFVDIAGLVEGASKGEGLGNKFLSHIREVDAICHVLRHFEDGDITHVSGRVNPDEDLDVIRTELILADMATVEKRLHSTQKVAKAKSDKETEKQLATLEKIKAALDQNVMANTLELTDDEKLFVRDLHLLTMKPELYVYNISEENIANMTNTDDTIYISAKIESELAELDDTEQKEMLESLGMSETGLSSLIKAGYEKLDLITFLTTGPEESRAWTVKKGTKAPQAAAVIHTDFEKAFIRAEVYNWKDLVEYGSEAALKEKGLLKIEGKDYIVQDGDVCHFRIGG